MSLWTARVSEQRSRNGTTSHTVPTARGAATPAGAFLMVVVAGGSTAHTAPAGWTSALSGGGDPRPTVFYKNASAAEASVAITGGNNRPLCYESFEFPAGTTYTAGALAISTATATWDALTGLSGANFFYAATSLAVDGTSGSSNTTWSGTGATELTDYLEYLVTINGYLFSSEYAENLGLSSWTPSSSTTQTAGSSTTYRRLLLGLTVAAPGVSGQIKAYSGSAWVAKPAKVWNGSAWITRPVKRWSGSAWVTTPY